MAARKAGARRSTSAVGSFAETGRGVARNESGIAASIDPISDSQRGYSEYEIDIEKILRQDLPIVFHGIEQAALTVELIANIPARAKGAYLLYLDGKMVYAGKTDTRHGFRDRLRRHVDSVKHRVGLDPAKMSFKALRIMVFSAFDVEAILISEMRRLDREALAWNDSGFGSNDPGKRRDDGEPAPFDRDFPVDIDIPLASIATNSSTVSELLGSAKSSVSYLLRYGSITGYDDAAVNPTMDTSTMRGVLRSVAAVLPNDFQITIFPGRVILYRERRNYEYAREVMRGTV